MLIFGLIIIFAALLIVSIIAKIASSNQYNDWPFVIGVSFIALIVTAVVAVWVYSDNATRVAELKAFQEVNVQNYSVALTGTKAILSDEQFADKIVAGSLEKTGTSQSIADRLREWRDAVNAQNMEVANKQKTRTLWLYPGWLVMPREVMDLKLLTIQ